MRIAVGVVVVVGVVVALLLWHGRGRQAVTTVPTTQAGHPGPGTRPSPKRDSAPVATKPGADWAAPELLNVSATNSDLDLERIVARAPIAERIRKLTDELACESPLQSVEKLSQVGAYYWPGFLPGASMGIPCRFPLDDNIGIAEAEEICSNRRFMKVIAELGAMPRAAASDIVSAQMDETFVAYRQQVTDFLKALREGAVGKATLRYSQISDNKDGSPTFQGLRHKLLALLLLAGQMELDGCWEGVAAVVQEGLRQRQALADPSLYAPGDGVSLLAMFGIYNRQVMSAALLGVYKDKAVAAPKSWKRQERRLTAYDAMATPYDLLTADIPLVPPDYSKGEARVYFYSGVGDDEFIPFAQRLVGER